MIVHVSLCPKLLTDKDYDTPYQPLSASETAFNLNTQYETTEVYEPSGGTYVPLGSHRWSWITTGYESNGVWSPPTGGLATMSGETDFDLTTATWYLVW